MGDEPCEKKGQDERVYLLSVRNKKVIDWR